ncbi:type II toxin-antitoxin system Phd/YefM family antitoxin [Levilactobacillus wangkuiensis]|uniref:type II toxin-antitoxin system Phd/YefM family antitoxin n=1 Tax=Levilactobacillus wangkuiensis TaxID=2799566 RepID=UPI0019448756|nr:type II toxin-antitoxin system prevent-host-death family antitoxin [Levilactobacillus wangkuiensis]
MKATTYSGFRKNLKAYLDQATLDFEPVTVTRKNAPNAVVISEVTYNNLVENQFLTNDSTNYEWILQGIQQIKDGKLRSHDLAKPKLMK